MDNSLGDRTKAEELLGVHDELDALDKKESYTALAIIVFLVAAVLMGFGMSRESLYLMVNGLFSASVGVVLGGMEVSRLRRMSRLRHRIEEIEGQQLDPPEEGPALGSGE